MIYGQFEFENPKEITNSLSVTSSPEGLYIEVEQEIAIDSYNSTALCAIMLDVNQAKRLLEFLQTVIK